jgi:hypothetical protein
VLLAAAGLALAAGVLSLVRLAPESGVPGLGTAEAGPRTDLDPGRRTATERSTDTAATVSAAPRPGATAADVMGGVSATATPGGVSRFPLPAGGPSSSAAAVPGAPAGTASAAPWTPPATPGTGPSATDPAPAPPPPAPSASSGPTTPPPGQTGHPGQPDDPGAGLCLPIIRICVGLGLG